ncbi:MAG: hypothetical protein ACKVQC_09190 [Elusimicrobiota bacterium]
MNKKILFLSRTTITLVGFMVLGLALIGCKGSRGSTAAGNGEVNVLTLQGAGQ